MKLPKFSIEEAVGMIEDTLISLWKEGKVLRSLNPRTTNGEYVWVGVNHAEMADVVYQDLGGVVTYEEFQSQVESA